MYVKVLNQAVEKFPYSINDLKKDNPQVSFPEQLTDALLAEFNVFPVVATEPGHDPASQVATQNSCFYNADQQRWETAWAVRDLTVEELEAAYQASIPQVVSIRQAKLALLEAGLLNTVNAAVAAADQATQIEWEYATEIRRDWPTLVALTPMLGLTNNQIDQLFIVAATL